jgi:hypothetical protein
VEAIQVALGGMDTWTRRNLAAAIVSTVKGFESSIFRYRGYVYGKMQNPTFSGGERHGLGVLQASVGFLISLHLFLHLHLPIRMSVG